MLRPSLPSIEDEEESRIPEGLPRILDAHVQCFDMNAEEMDVIYDFCEREQKPMVMHVGRAEQA